MDNSELSVAPSLAQHFGQEKQALRRALGRELSPAQVVSETRRALDRTGLRFTRSVSDPQIQKAGLWLLEIIKSGAGVLDRATHAEVRLVEKGVKPRFFDRVKDIRPTLFYGSAMGFVVIGLLQSSALLVTGAAVLAGLHGLTNLRSELFGRLPFLSKPKALPSPEGQYLEPEAAIRTDIGGFLNQISEALATADHILARMGQSNQDLHWRDDQNLMALFQNLLEANATEDGKYALQVVGKEMKTVLSGAGIETVTYSQKTAHWFDELPALVINQGDPDIEMAAPALATKDGRLLRRGTVWIRRS